MAELQELVLRLTGGSTTPAQRAVALHTFVRDIAFGFTAQGHCNPKASLFVDLLRAAGFQARIHAVNIDAGILAGCFPDWAGPRRVTHTYTEVQVPPQERWIRVDSYTVDRPLHEAAVARLRLEGRPMGWGVHARGTVDWDGASDAFCQYVEPEAQAAEDLGVFDSIEQVMRHPLYLHRGPLGLTYSSLLRPAALLLPAGWVQRVVNGRVDALRAAGGERGASS
ncbi:hypothetical protein CHLNCDRAFT_137466 [Chlorella variabilis]|uniref:Transglutaminase-like domain-containing protein n=1 Tax=Chlorella variabilis TaxID=554065 RepID=E1ZMH9_CHLVA|nr:hypothetical protein CHLNCDRAFT_137466 [Chlorella variabilis]EFN53115.1 hypothetical protein CHLNCDRAFT_137466 [Chlorella variabilis]|eukprot:XP_005845217.1 hypothetical protein CHLNCDRAFT_137466 [Chlorella variabilis]